MLEKKKVTIAEGTTVKKEYGKKTQSSNADRAKRNVTLNKNLNPIQRSKENIKRSYDVRKTRENYGDKIKSIQEEQDSDINDVLAKIKFYRKENEKMIRQQTLKFGLTLDEIKHVKEELDKAKISNDSLYYEVEARKEECEKLQNEMDYLEDRIHGLSLNKSDLLHEKRVYETEKLKLHQTEDKVQNLLKSNREIRSLLLHHKIDPKSDASKIAPMVKTISPKNDLSTEIGYSRFPKIYHKHSLHKYRSVEDVRPKKRPVRQIPLRRTLSYNQQTMTAKEFLRRRQSDTNARIHPAHIEVFV